MTLRLLAAALTLLAALVAGHAAMLQASGLDDGESGRHTTLHDIYFRSKKDLWKQWVPAEVAEKVEAGLYPYSRAVFWGRRLAILDLGVAARLTVAWLVRGYYL